MIQHTRCEPETVRTVQVLAVEVRAIQYYPDCPTGMDNEEFQANIETTNAFTEVVNAGIGISGGFENTDKLKPMKYTVVIDGPDDEA